MMLKNKLLSLALGLMLATPALAGTVTNVVTPNSGGSFVAGKIPVATDGRTITDSGKVPPAGAIVGTTDSQTLTNKSIDGAEITSGTVPAARIPIGTGLQVGGSSTIDATGGRARRASVSTDQTMADADCNKIYDNTSISTPVKVTVQAAAKPGCTVGFIKGLANTFVDFASEGLRIAGWVNNPVTGFKLGAPGEQDGVFQMTFDGTYWGPSYSSIVMYDQMFPGDTPIYNHGQIHFGYNAGLNQFEVFPNRGPGGTITNGHIRYVPDAGLFLPKSATSNSVWNYFYIYSNTNSDGVVSGAVDNSLGTHYVRLTLTHGETTGSQIMTWCTSIKGAYTANGYYPATIIDGTHADEIGNSASGMGTYTAATGMCRLESLRVSTTAPVVIGNGVLSLPGDAHYTYVGKALIDGSHTPTQTLSYWHGDDDVNGALKGNGDGTYQQATASDLSNGVTGSGSVVLGTSPTITTPVITSIIDGGGHTLTLPGSTDTVVGKATTDTFTNKTYDTAGTGNAFKLNGVTISTGSSLNKELWMAGNFVENTIASATATDLTVATGPKILISGTTTITSFTATNNSMYLLKFGGVLILTNSINLNLPGGANITTAANDMALLTISTSGAARILSYTRAALTPDVAPVASPTFTGTITGPDASTWASGGITMGAAISMVNHNITNVKNVVGNTANSYELLDANGSATVPTVIPNKGATTTGIGADTSGDVSIITGGTENMRFTSTTQRFMVAPSTGTNADFLCMQSNGTILIQASACTISSMRFKNINGIYVGDVEQVLGKLKAYDFTMKNGASNGDPNAGALQTGLLAEDVAAAEPKCAIYEQDMKTPKSYRQECILALMVDAVNQLTTKVEAQAFDIDKLQKQVKNLKKHHD